MRTIELLEASGRLDRKVEGLLSSEELLRRGQESRGLTRPELAVVLSMSKMALQDAIEQLDLANEKLLEPELFAAFPKPMRNAHAAAIRVHRLRNEIIATRVANRLVNRLGPGVALDMTEEEGASLGQVAVAFLVVERLLDLEELWEQIETAPVAENVRVELFTIAASSIRAHLSDMLRATGGDSSVSALVQAARTGRAPDFGRRDQADPDRSAQRSRDPPRTADRSRRERGHRAAAWSACSSSTACSASPRSPRAARSTSWR